LDMYKKRRKDDSCTSTSPTVWSLPLARPRAGCTRSQPQHQGNAKGVKKTSVVEPNLYCVTGCLRRAGSPFFCFSLKGTYTWKVHGRDF
jgi:hypothetical protein